MKEVDMNIYTRILEEYKELHLDQVILSSCFNEMVNKNYRQAVSLVENNINRRHDILNDNTKLDKKKHLNMLRDTNRILGLRLCTRINEEILKMKGDTLSESEKSKHSQNVI